MRRTLVALLTAVSLVVSVGALPASAAKKKTVTEEWEVTAAPFPGAEDHTNPATECGTEGVNYAIHTFKTPGRGTLEAAITFEGEWDLYVTDSKGTLLASSVQFMAGSEERVTVRLPARAEVKIYACNFLGGPTASGELKYVYRR
jgi:hypothetical protein